LVVRITRPTTLPSRRAAATSRAFNPMQHCITKKSAAIETAHIKKGGYTWEPTLPSRYPWAGRLAAPYLYGFRSLPIGTFRSIR